eukprot:30269_1
MASRWWRWMTLNIHTKTYSNPEYWICGFCRSYVKQSKVPIMRLEQELNLSTIEMKTVRKVGPVLCQHCYRVRLDYSRFQLVSELISYWIFYFFVGPLLVVLFGFFVCLSSLCENTNSETHEATCEDYYGRKLNAYLNEQS